MFLSTLQECSKIILSCIVLITLYSNIYTTFMKHYWSLGTLHPTPMLTKSVKWRKKTQNNEIPLLKQSCLFLRLTQLFHTSVALKILHFCYTWFTWGVSDDAFHWLCMEWGQLLTNWIVGLSSHVGSIDCCFKPFKHQSRHQPTRLIY